MGLPELSLRVRIFLFFALLMVLSVLFIGSAIYLAHQSNPDELSRLLATYTGVAATIIVLVLLLIWQLFDRYVAQALQSLARQMQTVLHADCRANEKGLKQREPFQYLGSISDAADELIEAYQSLKEQRQHRTDDNGASVVQARHLATIVRDLSVGVLVMNREHEILLYNHRALTMINRSDGVGLARSALALFDGTELLCAVNRLLDESPKAHPPAGIKINLTPARHSQCFAGKLNAIVSDDECITGYVLLLDDSDVSSNLGQSTIQSAFDNVDSDLVRQSVSALPSRPEFFDFGLFDGARRSSREVRPLRSLDFVVFDTETTGLNPSGGDQMISIGAVRIVNGRVLSGECFDELICPGISVPSKSTAFHGITDDMLEGKPAITDVLPRFAEFVGDAVLVAHNAAFDMKFIELQSKRCGVTLVNPVLDTVLLSAFVHDHSARHTLDDVAERFGIDIPNRHTALGDALATAQVFVRLVEQLACRDIVTLNDALNASNKMTHITRHQKSY